MKIDNMFLYISYPSEIELNIDNSSGRQYLHLCLTKCSIEGREAISKQLSK